VCLAAGFSQTIVTLYGGQATRYTIVLWKPTAKHLSFGKVSFVINKEQKNKRTTESEK
jgi:hypothetical protein